jgi:hypothetical protein
MAHLRQSGIREGIEYLFSIEEREIIYLPPRRERQSPDPEDREVRRRGKLVGNPEME